MKGISEHDKAVLNSIFNPLMPVGDFEDESQIHLADEAVDMNPELLSLEKEAVMEAEKGNLQRSIELFSEVIVLDPTRASSFNNRAQSYRLAGNNEDAMKDLNRAIELIGTQGRTACQAHNQRGTIYRMQKKDEEARADFEVSAKLGSEFAKQQLVQLNPYAALCNKMLHDVITKLRNGESVD